MVGQKGFTLVELMIVVAIIAILAAVAYPNYQDHVRRTKRTDMMTELVAMGGKIEATKLAQGSYKNVSTSDYAGNFPKSGAVLYTTSMTAEEKNGRVTGWTLRAEPKSGTIMAGDGVLSYASNGVKCRGDNKCGTGDEWRN